MKKALLSAALLLSSLGAYAQQDAITSAFFYQKDGKLDKAKEEIDRAVKNEKTSDKAKTWYFKATIYRDIAVSPIPAYKALSSNALSESFHAYQRCIALDKSKEYTNSAQSDIKQLWGAAFNEGVESYKKAVDKATPEAEQKGYYQKAIRSYDLADTIQPGDTATILYTAYAAEAIKDYARVKESYQKLFKLGRKTPDMYRTLASYAATENNLDEAIRITQEGEAAFPNDRDLAVDELSYLGRAGRLGESISKIEAAITKNAGNNKVLASLYATLGSLQDKAGDDAKKPAAERTALKQKAVDNYGKTLENDPNNVDANFNLGVYYFNQGVSIANKVRDMTLNDYNKTGKKLEAQAKDLYAKSLPYFEKVNQLQPNDPQIRKSLKVIYTALGRKADADKFATPAGK